jgi:hypothetical protein
MGVGFGVGAGVGAGVGVGVGVRMEVGEGVGSSLWVGFLISHCLKKFEIPPKSPILFTMLGVD